MKEVTLNDSDPQVWGKCPYCCASYNGKKVGTFFAKAYTRKEWSRGPKCENCNMLMAFMYEVK